MPLTSGKFKYLEIALQHLSNNRVPEFFKVESKDFFFSLDRNWILRSALSEEGELGNTLSGKSLSISGINSKEKFENAFDEIFKQPQLEEMILQEEIEWDKHYTLIWEKDFVFVESKTEQDASRFLYWTPLVKTGNPLKITDFLNLLKPLHFLLKESPLWLLEIGEKSGVLYLFQIQPIAPTVLVSVFSQDLVSKMISSRLRFAKMPNLFELIRIEWHAKNFRKKAVLSLFQPSFVFQNWEYIFNYFRLFCMLRSVQPSGDSFSQFLSEAHQKSFFGNLLKRHLELGNLFRINELDSPMEAIFQDEGIRFIGSGVISGKIGQEIVRLEKLDLILIYSSNPPKIIISKDVSLLSHSVLASVERGILLVLGVQDPIFSELTEGKSVFFDFEKKIFRLELK